MTTATTTTTTTKRRKPLVPCVRCGTLGGTADRRTGRPYRKRGMCTLCYQAAMKAAEARPAPTPADPCVRCLTKRGWIDQATGQHGRVNGLCYRCLGVLAARDRAMAADLDGEPSPTPGDPTPDEIDAESEKIRDGWAGRRTACDYSPEPRRPRVYRVSLERGSACL